MASPQPVTTKRSRTSFKMVPLHEERLERKLALIFGFMFFIPFLILTFVIIYKIDLKEAVYYIVMSAFIGYLVAYRMVGSVVTVIQKVRELSSGEASGTIDVGEQNEIGELARTFNRITQELEQKIDELESSRQLVKKLLSRIGTAIVSYEGIDNLLSLVMENAAAALEAQMGVLMLVDGEKQDLYLKATWSSNGQATNPGVRVKLGEGVAGWVAREGRSMHGKSMADAFGFAATHTNVDSAVVCVPLKLRDHSIGVMAVLRETAASPFTEDDEMLLTSIGSQMAVAIENYRLNLDVERTYVETIMALALAVEAKDTYSAGHSKRVGFYAQQIGEMMKLDEETLRMLNHAGVLHDIGKIGIKDEILLKSSPLTPDETKIMQQHPIIGEAIVKPVRSLQRVVELVRGHHERYDGGGYPGGLKGEEIPLGARILAVADTYDAMITDRPYRKRLPLDTAKAELKKLAGTQLDPAAVEAFLRVLSQKETRLAAAKAAGHPA